MSEVKSEIFPETNKIYKTSFTYCIDKFVQKLGVVSYYEFEISAFATCRLEVHPNFNRHNHNNPKYTKLVLRIGAPKSYSPKPREVSFQIRSSKDIAIWVDKFSMDSCGCEKVKEEFFNQLYARSYMEGDVLKLIGSVTVKEMDWEPANDPIQTLEFRQKKLVQDIHSLSLSGVLSDFKFIVQGREFQVHKAILAARSLVFERMFTGNFREATATQQEIRDVTADTFKELLHFIYAGSIENQDIPLEDLIIAADRYEVTDLIKFCELKLLENINDDNAELIFRLSHNIQLPNMELKKTAFEILQSKFKRFSIELPDELLNHPEKVFNSLDLKKKLEDSVIFSAPTLDDTGSFTDTDEMEMSRENILEPSLHTIESDISLLPISYSSSL